MPSRKQRARFSRGAVAPLDRSIIMPGCERTLTLCEELVTCVVIPYNSTFPSFCTVKDTLFTCPGTSELSRDRYTKRGGGVVGRDKQPESLRRRLHVIVCIKK